MFFFILQVQLTIRTLPDLPLGAKYKCVFGDADPIDATVTATGLSCPTPDLQSRPAIPTSSINVANSVLSPSVTGSSHNTVTDHVLVPLSVRSRFKHFALVMLDNKNRKDYLVQLVY